MKPGIRIVSEMPGGGPVPVKGDRVRLRYDLQLNHGDCLARDRELVWMVGDREVIAGLRYGLEGMRPGGTRSFRAGAHLCYGIKGCDGVPPDAVLIFEIRHFELLSQPVAADPYPN